MMRPAFLSGTGGIIGSHHIVVLRLVLRMEPEAEFLDVIRTKVLRVFLLATNSHLYKRILLPPSMSKVA
jgi:hypothetical protein